MSLSDIQQSLTGSTMFLHACMSGLDKAPLEAALIGIPVLTENPSTAIALGHTGQPEPLMQQIQSFLELSPNQQARFVKSQGDAVRSQHSVETLGDRIGKILFSGVSQ
jgi:hypothetical protein